MYDSVAYHLIPSSALHLRNKFRVNFDKFTEWWTSLGLVKVRGVRRTATATNISMGRSRQNILFLFKDMHTEYRLMKIYLYIS